MYTERCCEGYLRTHIAFGSKPLVDRACPFHSSFSSALYVRTTWFEYCLEHLFETPRVKQGRDSGRCEIYDPKQCCMVVEFVQVVLISTPPVGLNSFTLRF